MLHKAYRAARPATGLAGGPTSVGRAGTGARMQGSWSDVGPVPGTNIALA